MACILLLLQMQAFAFGKDEIAIRNVLAKQSAAWNKGDIEAYMQGYWHNDSLVFVGKHGPTYGYDATLKRYKTSYPDVEKMGKLQFTIVQVKQLSQQYYSVLGKWQLARKAGDLEGYFTLLFRKINGQWLIVSDHSS